MSPSYPRLHYAILPTGSDAELLAARLARFNIQVLTYPNHETLWDCIESLPERLVGIGGTARAREYPLSYEQMRIFLASCYVQSKMSGAAAPLRDLVVRGIILSLLEQEKGRAATSQLSRLLRQIIPLGRHEAELVTVKAVDALIERGLVSSTDNEIRIEKLPPKALEDNVDTLVRGVLNRLLVREGVDEKTTYTDAVRTVLQEVFFSRGWDLGAEFAGARTVGRSDLYDLIKGALAKVLPAESFERQSRIANALYDLLRRPDEVEARILSDVARLSFGLNVILKVGNSALRLEALPERIYFDASILMPAITDGHPFRPVYQSTIDKISEAVRETGKTCELLVISEFLNEIVSHRRRAVRMVKELGLEDPERLVRHTLYYGAENTNVFVGSYASWVGRQKNQISFNDFLNEAAPYSSEASLATFIERLGIRTVQVPLGDPKYKKIYQGFVGSLGHAYREFDAVGWGRDKADVLVEHEALQLAQIELEMAVGRRTLFVTADKTLREIVNTIRLGTVWNVVMSHLGLVQLTDLLLGVDAEPRSLARVLWGIMEIHEHAALRDYFIDLALRKYDEALVMTLPQIIEEFVSDAERAANQEGVKFFTKQVADTVKAARFLDRFEVQFFEKMADIIRKRKGQEKNQ